MEIVRRRLRERRFSRRTEETYVHWIRRFIMFHGRRHPRDLVDDDVAAFLSHLAVERGMAASTQNQARAALAFLYDHVLARPLGRLDDVAPARTSRHVPVVLSERELRAILGNLAEPYRLCAMLMYGSGLRLLECMTLRVKDVDVDRRELVIRGGKGDKDRRVPLADVCVPPLERRLTAAGVQFESDRRRGVRTTGISDALLRKYPNADREWRWQYVFSARRTFVDGARVRRRHHLHESMVQRTVRRAVAAGEIAKRVTCHSFATHLLEKGGGHSDRSTVARA